MDNARPARTSSDELVTPPKRGIIAQIEGRKRNQPKPRTLVGTRILEQDHLSLFQVKARLLREEEIRSFHNILEMGFALRVDESRDVRDVNCLRSEKRCTV